MRFVLLASFLLLGCQSESEGFATLCQSVERCVTCRGLTVEMAQQAHWQWVDEHVKNGTAREAIDALMATGTNPSESLREIAGEAGVHPCALADHLENEEGMHRAWGSTDIDTALQD